MCLRSEGSIWSGGDLRSDSLQTLKDYHVPILESIVETGPTTLCYSSWSLKELRSALLNWILATRLFWASRVMLLLPHRCQGSKVRLISFLLLLHVVVFFDFIHLFISQPFNKCPTSFLRVCLRCLSSQLPLLMCVGVAPTTWVQILALSLK